MFVPGAGLLCFCDSFSYQKLLIEILNNNPPIYFGNKLFVLSRTIHNLLNYFEGFIGAGQNRKISLTKICNGLSVKFKLLMKISVPVDTCLVVCQSKINQFCFN